MVQRLCHKGPKGKNESFIYFRFESHTQKYVDRNAVHDDERSLWKKRQNQRWWHLNMKC